METGRRAETRNGWSHTHVWRLRIGRDVSAVEVPLGGVLAPHRAPRPRAPVPGREVPTTGCENQRRWWPSDTEPARVSDDPLKGPAPDSPRTDLLVGAPVQRLQLRAARDAGGGTELSGVRARAWGQPPLWLPEPLFPAASWWVPLSPPASPLQAPAGLRWPRPGLWAPPRQPEHCCGCLPAAPAPARAAGFLGQHLGVGGPQLGSS